MNNAKKSLVPHRRFKEFQNAGAWEQRKLGEVVKRETCQVISSNNNPSVEYDDVVSEQGELNKDVLAKHSVKKGIQFNKNHILYGKLRPYLHNWLNPNFKGVAVGDWWVLKPKNDIEKSFLDALIQTQRYDNVANISTGSKMPRADWNLVSNTNFAIPSQLDEQLKIGEVFSQLDSLIALHQRKLNKLKKLKSAYLTEMFPDEGEHKPKRRFAGFTDDWEQRKLGDTVNSIVAGGDIDKSKIQENGKYPVYANALTNDGVIGYYNDQYRVKAPAVTVTGRGEIGVAKTRNTNFTPVVRLLAINSMHNNYFLENLINTHRSFAESTGVPQLTAPQLANYKLKFPKSIEEESKIGNFFNNLDSLITLHQRKIDKLQKLKNAYLNEMFV